MKIAPPIRKPPARATRGWSPGARARKVRRRSALETTSFARTSFVSPRIAWTADAVA